MGIGSKTSGRYHRVHLAMAVSVDRSIRTAAHGWCSPHHVGRPNLAPAVTCREEALSKSQRRTLRYQSGVSRTREARVGKGIEGRRREVLLTSRSFLTPSAFIFTTVLTIVTDDQIQNAIPSRSFVGSAQFRVR